MFKMCIISVIKVLQDKCDKLGRLKKKVYVNYGPIINHFGHFNHFVLFLKIIRFFQYKIIITPYYERYIYIFK